MFSPATRHFLRLLLIALSLMATGAGPPHGQQDLRGKITIDKLYTAFPVFRTGADAYRPEPDAVQELSRINLDTKIVAFLGTWCLDSRSEIPALLKTLTLSRNRHIFLELIAVDRGIDDGTGDVDRLKVFSVPTIIVFRNNREIGRIRGLARESMESDILHILVSSPP